MAQQEPSAAPMKQSLLNKNTNVQHRLLFDNGAEIDLSKSSLIAAARPKPVQQPGQFRTPSRTRNPNIILQNKTLQATSNSALGKNKQLTPVPGARNDRAANAMADVVDGYPLQKVYNLQKLHSNEASKFRSSFRVRHASAHYDSQTSAVEN